MLQNFRQLSNNFIFKILLMLLASSFLLWGVSDFIRGNLRSEVITYTGGAISTAQWEKAIGNYQVRMEQTLGRKLQPKEIDNLKHDPWILLSVVNGTLVELIAKEWGLEPDNNFVAKLIQSDPTFQDKDGNFDHAALVKFLAYNQMSEDQYIKALQEERMRENLVALQYEPTTPLTGLKTILARFQREQRRADILTLKYSSIKLSDPTAEELEDYYAAEKDSYTNPEAREIAVALLKPSTGEQAEPSEDELKQAYEEQKSTLIVAENRDILHLVFPEQAQAASAVARLRKDPKHWASAALELTQKPIADNMMYAIQFDSLPNEFRQPTFSAKAHAVLDPINTELGWHVLAVVAIHPEAALSYAEARPQLAAQIIHSKAAETYSQTIRSVEDGIAGGEDFAAICKRLNLTILHPKPFSAQGATLDGTLPRDFPKPWWDKVVVQAYAATTSNPTEIIALDEANQDAYAIVQLTSIIPEAAKPLADIKLQVAKDWREDELHKQAQTIALQMQQMAEAGKSLQEIANTLPVSIELDRNFKRPFPGRKNADGSERLEKAVFAIAAEGKVSKPLQSIDEQWQVVVLRKIQPFAGALNSSDIEEELSHNKALQNLQAEIAGSGLFQYLYRHFAVKAHGQDPAALLLNELFVP